MLFIQKYFNDLIIYFISFVFLNVLFTSKPLRLIILFYFILKDYIYFSYSSIFNVTFPIKVRYVHIIFNCPVYNILNLKYFVIHYLIKQKILRISKSQFIIIFECSMPHLISKNLPPGRPPQAQGFANSVAFEP
jgi:hypothetical protein